MASAIYIRIAHLALLLNFKVQPSDGDLVFHTRAYVGTAALTFSDSVGKDCRVYCFEPVIFEMLERKMRRNEIGNTTIARKTISHFNDTTEIK